MTSIHIGRWKGKPLLEYLECYDIRASLKRRHCRCVGDFLVTYSSSTWQFILEVWNRILAKATLGNKDNDVVFPINIGWSVKLCRILCADSSSDTKKAYWEVLLIFHYQRNIPRKRVTQLEYKEKFVVREDCSQSAM